jgi:CRISPR-associated protein, csm2 family
MDLNTPQVINIPQDIRAGQAIFPKIFSDIAEAAAKRISQNGDKQNKSTQLRKYYDELSMWDDKIHRAADRNTEYQKSAPYIHMLRAKVAYASNRKSSGTPLVDEYFVRIFNHIINQIDSAETLHHAKLFYEAMLGFRKAQESK